MDQHVEAGCEEGPGETTPLIASPTEVREASPTPNAQLPPSSTICSWPWIYIIALCIIMAVLSDIGESLWTAPRIRLFESVVCTRYYLKNDPSKVDRDGTVPEKLCKINAVQDEVASVLGWQFFFDSIPAVLLSIPCGYLADKHGRKGILLLAMIGITLSYAWTLSVVGPVHLPLQFVWFSSIFFLIGGGPTTATTMLTTIVADIAPPELRSTVFFYRFCTDLIAELFVPPLTSILMTKNVWIPLIGTVIFQSISTVMILAVPETLPMPIPEQLCNGSESPLSATNTSDLSQQSIPVKRWRRWYQKAKDSFSFAVRDPAVGALILTFSISRVGRQSGNVLFQYASKRYGWSLSQAGLLLSLRAAVNIALFIAILPAITNFALSRLSPPSRDLLLAKGSVVFLIVGALGIFLSATPAVMITSLVLFTLGTGFPPIVRSLVTYLVESSDIDKTCDGSKTSDIGRLYSLISVMEGIGNMVAAPGMAGAFRLGMRLGQEWLGLPFGLAAVLFALVSIIVFSTNIQNV